jgi:hypothetical protein
LPACSRVEHHCWLWCWTWASNAVEVWLLLST